MLCRVQPEALTEEARLVEGGLVPTQKRDRGHQSQGTAIQYIESSKQSVQTVPFKIHSLQTTPKF